MNRKVIFEYLRTIAISALVAFLLVIALLGIVKHQVYSEQNAKKMEDNSVDFTLITLMIEKNQYLESQHPENFRINLKLGMLYEIQKDYSQAEKEYKLAAAKAPYGNFVSQYKLASLYIKINHLADAQQVMDKIEELPNKKLIAYKGDVYEKLGDKYYNAGDYEAAVEKYSTALYYYKIIKRKKVYKYLKDSLASSYVYLGEEYLDNMKLDEAINSFKMAVSLVDAPILKYKLAILLIGDDPDLAYKYFEEVFEKEPNIINYDTYNNFLARYAQEAEANDEEAQAQLYRFKMQQLKEYFKSNILSVNDITVVDVRNKIVSDDWKRLYRVALNFKLENTSKNKLDSLYLYVIFKDNKDRIIQEYSEKVINNKTALSSGSITPAIDLKIQFDKLKEDVGPKEIKAEIYVAKTDHNYRILIKSVNFKEKVKKKKINKYVMQFVIFVQKATSKLPSFLY